MAMRFNLDAFEDSETPRKRKEKLIPKPKALKSVFTSGQNEVSEGLQKLRRDMRNELFKDKSMTPEEMRFIVGAYYQHQENRIRAANQLRELISEEKSHAAIKFAVQQHQIMEDSMSSILMKAVEDMGAIGKWLMSIYGIGHIISAALIAHIDITRVKYAGQIFSYAGIIPGKERKKGEKLTYNPELKKLCWKIGHSFVLMGNPEKNYYRRIYDERKLYEQAKNARGDYADQAAKILATKNIEAPEYLATLASGKLSDAHINSRCQRYAVKMFLSHFFEMYYFYAHNELPPRPFVIEHEGHTDYVRPPNSSLIPGFDEALEKDDRPKIPRTYRMNPNP